MWEPGIEILSATAVLTLAGAWGLNRVLFSWEKRRLEKVQKRDTFAAVQTETPHDEPKTVAQSLARESIQSHFRNTRRLLLPLVLSTGLVVAALPYLSLVPAAALSLLLGAATVVAGIAARPPVENFIAGLVMGFSQVLNIGDTVTYDGHYATVEDISMTHTILKIWDWRRLVIPNAKMLSSEFQSYSLTDPFLWAYIEFWVAYESDIEEVERLAVEAARQSKHYAGYEDPGFWVMETSQEGVKCWLAAWADTPADAWFLKADMRNSLFKAFRRCGIKTHAHNFATGPAKNEQSPPISGDSGQAVVAG